MRENNVVKPLWSLWFCDNIPVRSQECAEYGTEFGLWMWGCDCSAVGGLFQSLAPGSLLLPQMLPQHWSCWLLCPSKPCVPVNTWIVLGLGDPVGQPKARVLILFLQIPLPGVSHIDCISCISLRIFYLMSFSSFMLSCYKLFQYF